MLNHIILCREFRENKGVTFYQRSELRSFEDPRKNCLAINSAAMFGEYS